MVIEVALEAKLLAVLAALVGDRVYPDALPERDDDALPASVVYQRAGDDTPGSLNAGRSNVRAETYTVELWSRLRSDGWAFRELMLAAFTGKPAGGRWGGGSGVWVCGAVASDAQADAREPVDGGADPDRAERLSLRIVYDTDR